MEYITKIEKEFPLQPPENEKDNREYKRHLLFKEKNEVIFLNKRATQMKYRLLIGRGKAIYIIGIEDNGYNGGISENELMNSIQNILKIAIIINAEIKKIRIYKGLTGNIATVRLLMDISNDEILL